MMGPGMMGWGMRGGRGPWGRGPEGMLDRVEGRLAFVKAELRITRAADRRLERARHDHPRRAPSATTSA